MAPPTSYVSPEDLKTALGESTFLAIFDDANAGSVADDNPAVAQVIKRAHAEVLSYLPRVFKTLPEGIPELLFSAELDYAVAYAFERHPEYVRTFGEEKRLERWKRGEHRMDRVATTLQQIVDNAPAPPPPILTGGIVTNANPRATIIDSPDGTYNGGDF